MILLESKLLVAMLMQQAKVFSYNKFGKLHKHLLYYYYRSSNAFRIRFYVLTSLELVRRFSTSSSQFAGLVLPLFFLYIFLPLFFPIALLRSSCSFSALKLAPYRKFLLPLHLLCFYCGFCSNCSCKQFEELCTLCNCQQLANYGKKQQQQGTGGRVYWTDPVAGGVCAVDLAS